MLADRHSATLLLSTTLRVLLLPLLPTCLLSSRKYRARRRRPLLDSISLSLSLSGISFSPSLSFSLTHSFDCETKTA